MTKQEIVAKAAQAAGISKTQSEKVFNAIFSTIRDEVKNGEAVRITDFGTIKPATRAAREGRNPSTGESISIPEKKTVKLVVSSKFFD